MIIGAFFLPWKWISWGTFAWRPTSTVTVVGEAKSQVQNKKATFNAGINVVNDNKDKATTEANKKIADITDAVKAFGISEKDIKTQNLSIYQEEEPYTEGGRQKRRLGQWRVNNTIEIVLRDVEKASELADTLSKAGANSVYGPNFTLNEDDQSGTTLLTKAVENAKGKAEILARTAGKELGSIIVVSEGAANGQRTFSFEGGGMGGSNAELQPGTETVQKNVTVTWELKDQFKIPFPKLNWSK
jgi:uncharacterized protein YggE